MRTDEVLKLREHYGIDLVKKKPDRSEYFRKYYLENIKPDSVRLAWHRLRSKQYKKRKMEKTDRQREIYRAKLIKIYQGIDKWPVEDKTDWITLQIEEIHHLFTIAKREGYLEAIKELR